MIDSLALIVYLVFFLTITGATIYFKVLDRRHKMQIKKLQLCFAVMLGTLALSLGVCQLTTNAIILGLMD